MVIVALVGLAFLSVPLTGGRLWRLADIRLRHPWTAALAVALQVLIVTILPGGNEALHSGVHLFTYALLAAFVLLNRGVPGLMLLGTGGAMNLVAITANHGVMPASPAALHAAGVAPAPGEFTNSGVLAHPHLLPLGDVFATPAGMPLHNVFSVGDVVIMLGVLFLLHRVSRPVRKALEWHPVGARLALVRATRPLAEPAAGLSVAVGTEVHRFEALPAGRPSGAGFAVPRTLIERAGAEWMLGVERTAVAVAAPRLARR